MEKQKRKRKSKVKWIVTSVTLIAVCGAVAFMAYNSSKPQEVTAAVSIKTMPLMKTSIMDTISVSGAIYSANTKNIYSTQSYPIKEVYFKVGDEVKAGDVLAALDMSSIDYEVRQAENNILSSELSAAEDLKTNSNNVSNAELSLETATLSLEKQQINFENLQAEYEKETSSELINAQNSIDTALSNLNSAKKDVETKTKDRELKTNELENSKTLYNAGAITKSDLTSSETALDTALNALSTAESNYEQAVTNYEKALNNYENTKETLAQNLLTAEKDLENAELNYKSAQNSLSQAKSKTSSNEITIDNQKISLEKLQEQLGKDKIIATMDGIITEASASVGSTPTGVLFVIEDMNDLYVSANVMEYDLGDISTGQSAFVTTDVTDNQILNGEISYISPKAVSDAGSTTVEFEAHAKIIDNNPLLRIGMNAFLDIVIASKEDIYAVSYTVITTKPNGESAIYALDNSIVIEIPVEIGLETSTSVEISGDGLHDGMTIISNPTAVTVGQTVDTDSIEQGMRFRTSPGNSDTQGGTSDGVIPSGDIPSGAMRSGDVPSGAMRSGDMPSGGMTSGSGPRP